MTTRFQPKFEPLEAREVPAALSFRLADGSIGSALFSTPVGVDPAQSSQSLAVTDLAVVKGGATYVTQPGATANYASGVLVGVVATATGPGAPINLNNGTVTVGGYVAPVAYDAADTMVTFMLADGTIGAISYTVDWNLVNPDIASQTIPATAFKLNMGGQNFAYGSANYTIPPTLLFANGNFTGFNFALNTNTAPGFAYTSVSMNGLNTTVVVAGTGQSLFVRAAASNNGTLNFTGVTTGKQYFIDVEITLTNATGMTEKVKFRVDVGTDATIAVIRASIKAGLAQEGLYTDPVGDGFLTIGGKGEKQVTEISLLFFTRLDAQLKPISDATLTGPKFSARTGDVTYRLNGTVTPPSK